jgi:2-octaprenylphenol hydroxylase
VSAINAASEKLLTRWMSGRIARRASCYHGMEVWDKDSFGRISFDDQSMGFSHLGHIIENAWFIMRCGKRRSVAPTSLLAPAQLQQVAWGKTKPFSACRTAR